MHRLPVCLALSLLMPFGAVAGVLIGTVEAPDARRLPERLALRIRPVGSVEETVTEVRVENGRWRCEVPAGNLDVEIRARGFAPVYRWDLRSNGGGNVLDLGTIILTTGVGVAGRIVDERGAPVVRARVVFSPVTTFPVELRSRDTFRERATVTNRRGDFSFEDVSAGPHALKVEKEGYSSVARRVDVDAASSRLAAVVLARLTGVRVVLSPPADFFGRPWIVQLMRTSRDPQYLEIVRSGEAELSGEWRTRELDAGEYQLRVLTSRNEVVHKERVELAGDPLLPVRIEAVPLRGRITIGGDGVTARIDLVKPDGSSIGFNSDAAGEFAGFVTSEAVYRARIRTSAPEAELHMENIAVRRREGEDFAKVTIGLGDRRLRGKVTTADGTRVPGTVLLFRNGRLEANSPTSPSAEFDVIGLQEGLYEAKAMTKAGSSALTPVAATGDETEYTLIVIPRTDVSGRVVDASGNPVVGATVLARADEAEAERTLTGLSGEFMLQVPHTTRALSIAVIADGYPRKLVVYDRAAIDRRTLLLHLTGQRSRLGIRFAPPVGWPFVAAKATSSFVLFSLLVPRPGVPLEFKNGTFTLDVEPGEYVVCPGRTLSPQCRSVILGPGETATVAEQNGEWR